MFRSKLRRAAIAPAALQIPKPIFAESIVQLMDEKTDLDIPEQFLEVDSEPDFTPWQVEIESALGHLLKLLRLRSLGCSNQKIAKTFTAPDQDDEDHQDEAREILVFTKFPSTIDRSIYKFANDSEGRRFVKCLKHGEIDYVNDEMWFQETYDAFLEVLRVLAQEGVGMDMCCFFEMFRGHCSPVGTRRDYLDRLADMLADSLDISVWFGKAIFE